MALRLKVWRREDEVMRREGVVMVVSVAYWSVKQEGARRRAAKPVHSNRTTSDTPFPATRWQCRSGAVQRSASGEAGAATSDAGAES